MQVLIEMQRNYSFKEIQRARSRRESRGLRKGNWENKNQEGQRITLFVILHLEEPSGYFQVNVSFCLHG